MHFCTSEIIFTVSATHAMCALSSIYSRLYNVHTHNVRIDQDHFASIRVRYFYDFRPSLQTLCDAFCQSIRQDDKFRIFPV